MGFQVLNTLPYNDNKESCATTSSKTILRMVHNLADGLALASVDAGGAHLYDEAGRKAAFRGEGHCRSDGNLKKNFFKITCIYIYKQRC